MDESLWGNRGDVGIKVETFVVAEKNQDSAIFIGSWKRWESRCRGARGWSINRTGEEGGKVRATLWYTKLIHQQNLNLVIDSGNCTDAHRTVIENL